MAAEATINVKLQSDLDKAREDIGSLKKAGAFDSKQGAKSLNAIESLYNTLAKQDISKLSGPALTNFLNQLAQLRKYLDSSGKSLSNFSAEYQNALKKTEKAIEDQTRAQDKYNEVLKKQQAAQGKLKLDYEGTVFKNAKGHRISNPDTIADEYKAGTLKVFNKEGVELNGAAKTTRLNNTGIPEYAAAIQEVTQFKKELDEANEALKQAKEQLKKTPTGSSTHPTTEQVLTHSQETYGTISDIKEGVGNETENEISVTSKNLEQLSVSANKSTSSLGRAFRQFTLYAVALRAVKKALREAAQTIKELDRALTEQAMVTGLTRKQTYGLLKDYQNMAARLGSTTKEVSSTMTEFLRQGRSIAEASKLTEAAVSAAKVAGISAADSINYLTTAINGFRLSADEAMKVSDKFAAVAATAATSYEEIAIALSKVAAQANLAGMSIDYTTALLTKGIETTREAPETIGTALKTVIARMRELGDYGETLEGDTDINNVETQLAYIGIQLRNNNGELRSTEDVLNDLGAQWEDLDANQQAAIAKALAGTRQQSRLIAMMSDYERVIELQQIAERSQGATMAQMATYMEGMDAAMNKVSVAWEKIISTVTESDAIIGLVDTFAGLLEFINGILSNTAGMIAMLTTISLIGLSILNRKMLEYALSKQQQALELQRQKTQLKNQYIAAKAYLASQKTTLEEKRQLLTEKQTSIEKARQVLLDKNSTDAQKAEAQEAINQLSTEAAQLQIEIEKQENAQFLVDTYDQQNSLLESQQGLLGGIGGALNALTAPLFLIITLYKTISGLITTIRAKKAADHKKTLAEQTTENTANAMGAAGKIISNLGVWGIPIAIAVVAALIGATLGISAAVNNAKKQSFSGQVDSINKLSKEIFDLNKKFNALDTAINKFDDLDNKIIKTSADLKEMHDLVEAAADSLSDEEKEIFQGLTTDRAKREYLEQIRNETGSDLGAKREEQRQKILKLKSSGGANWNNFLTSNDAEVIQARDAMYALNNSALYAYIDVLKDAGKVTEEQATATEHLTQAILEQVDAEKASDLLKDPQKIEKYARAISSVVSQYKDITGETIKGSAAAILDSEDYSISERAAAYQELYKAIENLGDPDVLMAFKEAYSSWDAFSKTFSSSSLSWIDTAGVTEKEINALAESLQKLGYTSEQSAIKLNQLFTALEEGENLSRSIEDIFNLDQNSAEYKRILDSFDKNFGTTVLNMGQNMDKFTNSIDSFYQKAGEWATMSQTDRTSFISEHQDLFQGTSGAALLKAFESGNYAAMQQALAANEGLAKQRERLLIDINRQIEIEMARAEKDRNYAYIAELQEYKRQLQDTNNLYLASLQTRYDQQQKQLELYKDYLQQETDKLKESLDKRKEAYQKYFDAINQAREDEDYEEQAQLLISNVSKLSSSTNADAMAKTADLTKQLEELEKERLQTLRERAQEAIIKQMEDEVSKISDNIEKLLSNEQALLNAMLNDSQDSEHFIAALMSAQALQGNNTELGMQTYLEQMKSTFASIMPEVDWNDVDVTNQGNSVILNIAGKEIVLNEGEQQNIYDAILDALKQIGH